MLPKWLSAEALKWLVATLAIPVALGYVSYRYESAQTERQAKDAKLRLYTELMSKREEADTGLRKGIFDKVIETYLKPGSKDLDAQLVALELLALNFSDSLDLSPLFWQFDRQIQQMAQGKKRAFLVKQLDRISSAVKDRQIEVLGVVGDVGNWDIAFGEQQSEYSAPEGKDLGFLDLAPSAQLGSRLTRHFSVEVADHDPVGRRVFITVTYAAAEGKAKMLAFWVDVFDFPLTNFSRISNSERISVLLKRYNPQTASATLTLIYFPSARSGVKDKPFIDEVISDLRRESK